MTRDTLNAFVAAVKSLRESATDEQAVEAVGIYPVWAAGKSYEIGIRVQYDGILYRCLQSHDSQADWTPDATPALFTEVALPGEIPVWKQPTGAQDAYNTGDKVWYPSEDTTVYQSTIDNNVWSPDEYPQGWEAVT